MILCLLLIAPSVHSAPSPGAVACGRLVVFGQLSVQEARPGSSQHGHVHDLQARGREMGVATQDWTVDDHLAAARCGNDTVVDP